MRIAICTTHFTPALSFIDLLRQKTPDVQIIYFGRKETSRDFGKSLEFKVLPGIRNVVFLESFYVGWQRFIDVRNLFVPLLTAVGVIFSLARLLQYRPKMIVSFGGYNSVPVVLAGWILRIPVVVHVQTLDPGLSDIINALFSKKVFVSWPQTMSRFSQNKVCLTGNPLGKYIIRQKGAKTNSKYVKFGLPVLYVTGGNQGSQAINTAVWRILSWLLTRFVVVHQCGDFRGENINLKLKKIREELPPQLRKRYFAQKHFLLQKQAQMLKTADIVIARSGINTVCELIFLRKKAVLIPLPFSRDKEQEKNASLFSELGLGLVLNQNELTTEKLKKTIERLLVSNLEANQEMIYTISSLSLNASQKLYEEVRKIYDEETKS